MKTKIQPIIFSTTLWFGLVACNSSKNEYDATGVFEANEVIVASEANGKLNSFNVEEGQTLKAGDNVGEIDCKNIGLQKAQIEASLQALSQKQNDANPQVEVLQKQFISQKTIIATQKEQLSLLENEKRRVQNLVKAEAVPSKQLDDITGQIDVLRKQMESTQSQLDLIAQQIQSQKAQVSIQNRGIMSEAEPLKVRVAQAEEQLGHCQVVNPVDGTVLVKYAEANEFAAMGKPLYKIADLEEMTLRAYISGNQLSSVKLNQMVKVYVDKGKDDFKEYSGKIAWVSSKAEFTPKTIQTKDERSNLVYAIKIQLKNDGFIKIGMYGEVKF